MKNLDAPILKERERENWSCAAQGWRRQDALLRKGGAPVTRRMLELCHISNGYNCLDIASGTGEPAISIAQIVGDSGHVLATDLVEEMLAVARDKSEKLGLSNIEFQCMDGENLDYIENSFDAATLRWGLMFMPQPLACLKAIHKALKPSAPITLACWAAPEKNPFVSILMKCLAQYMELPTPPPEAPGIFAFADAKRLQGIIKNAGFKNIKLEEIEIDVLEVENGQAYWQAISDLAAPVMALVNQLSTDHRNKYIKDVITLADSMKQGKTLRMKGTTWIACAEK